MRLMFTFTLNRQTKKLLLRTSSSFSFRQGNEFDGDRSVQFTDQARDMFSDMVTMDRHVDRHGHQLLAGAWSSCSTCNHLWGPGSGLLAYLLNIMVPYYSRRMFKGKSTNHTVDNFEPLPLWVPSSFKF